MKHNQKQVQQLRVRSNLVAGASVEACMNNLANSADCNVALLPSAIQESLLDG